MNMMDTINNFVDTMLAEKTQFENMRSEVSKQEDAVVVVLDELEQSEKQIIESLNERISSSKDESIKAIFVSTSQSLFDTMQEAGGKIKEAVKGMTFIQDFESHFTVSVFGKVKAGKSYIGNFVMGQPLRKEKISSSYDKIDDLVVHVYDRGKMYEQHKLSTEIEKKECNGQEFYVNKSEATSTIQWVDIGGMCWFDTPGIGSVTIENEMLAKEYVKNSDLVIFACNSDAAGTRQEFAEIKQLHEMGKPLLLLLTQSDTYDFDVDEDGQEISILVAKSEKDRKDQEDYMLETLREQGLEDVLKYADILTVSAYLATEAIKSGNEEMFCQSNMGLLLEKLTEITKNDAAEIKKNTPKTRINEMIDSIISDLKNMQNQISVTCSSIEESKHVLLERKDWMLEQIKASVHIKVLEIVSKAKVKVEKEKNTISEEEITQEIDEAISKIVKNVCLEETISHTGSIPDLQIKLSGIGDMKMKQDRIAYEYTSVHSVTRPPKGLLENLGSFLFKKQYYTAESRTKTKYSTFDIGVNDNEIAQNIVLQLETVFYTTIDGYVNYLVQGYYEPVEILERKTIQEISNAIHKLQGLRM